MEETSTLVPSIRCTYDKHSLVKKGSPTPGTHADNKRNAVDKYCHFCGIHGHLSTSCDFMAKLIIANESLKKVDAHTKKESPGIIQEGTMSQTGQKASKEDQHDSKTA
jgi:hypothetical protein